MSAPGKDARQKCWDARDKYWTCLDDKNDDRTLCQQFRKVFEDSCSKTWLKYFERRREYLKFQAKIEKDGYEPINEKQ